MKPPPLHVALTSPAPASTPNDRRVEILKKLRPICGQPTAWTGPQKIKVADTMMRNKDDPGMQLLAPEWQRLNDQVLTCRGEAPKTR